MSRHAVRLGALFTQVADQGWRDDALCTQVDGDIFYPEAGGIPAIGPKDVCARCPVQAACLEYALEHETRGHGAWGIWAGLTVKERLDLLRARGTPAPPPNARVTAEIVEEIRARYAADPPITQPALALKYGMSRTNIAAIVSGKTWKQVPA